MIITTLTGSIEGPRNATIRVDSGDHVSIAYRNPNGEEHIINVSAQHLVFMAVEEKTEAALMMSPSMGIKVLAGR